MATGGSFDPPRDGASLSDMLKNHRTHIQALFRRYFRSRPAARPAIVEELLDRLQSHLEMEKYVLFDVVHHSGVSGIDLVEEVILEHDDVQAMVRRLQQFDVDDDHAWEELFEDMMQTSGRTSSQKHATSCRLLIDHVMCRCTNPAGE